MALQGHQQTPQYVYSSNSFAGQQASVPSSAGSAAYAPQSYAQQPYAQQSVVQQVQQSQGVVSQAAYGSNTTYSTLGGASQSQSAQAQAGPWSQQASAPGTQPSQQQQATYGRASTVVASASSGGGSSVGAGQYGGQYGSGYGTPVQGSSQQLLGSSRGVGSPDFQTQGTSGTRGSAAYGTSQERAINTGASYVVGGASSVSTSGVYGADAAKYDDTDKYGTGASSASFDGKNGEYGGGSSPSAYNKKAADQYGANYNVKSPDYSQSDRAQYGQHQSAYGQADSQGAPAGRRYQDTHTIAVVQQQRQQQQQQQQQQDRQDQQSQLLRQQQALQAQHVQAAAVLLSRGSTSSVLDGGPRNQGDYLGGSRTVPTRGTSSQDFGGQMRGLLDSSYGGSRSDADAGLLVSQYGRAGGRSSGVGGNMGYGAQQAAMYGVINAGRGMLAQMYPHSAPGVGYGGVQLPPGREYSAGRGTGGGGYIAGGSRSDRPSIGSSRFDDRRDDRQPPRRDGVRDDRRGGGRDRERDRSRTRDRERDAHRGRRDEFRKRERSPLRQARDHKEPILNKREDRSSRKESPRRDLPYRITSPVKEKRRDYFCKIEPYSFLETERDYTSLCKRYAKLYVVPEFSKLVVNWSGRGSQVCRSYPVSFEHDAVDVEDEVESKEAPPKSSRKASLSPSTDSPKGTITWNSKVMLMSGCSEAAQVELLTDSSVQDRPPHLHNLLKFVALRKDRSAITACGGAWDKDLDGGDPAMDENALIRTAIRCTKHAVQLDLSGCTSWLRFLEVYYERLGDNGLVSHKDVTVIFIPDLARVIPSLDEWQLQLTEWKQSKLSRDGNAKIEKVQESKLTKSGILEEPEDGAPAHKGEMQDKEDETNQDTEKLVLMPEDVEGKDVGCKDISLKLEELPSQPGLILTTKRTKSTKMRSMTISLDGLLDYDEEDREECTFELSVFAEVYQEMLQHKMGSLILSDLELLRETTSIRKREESKRLRSEGKEDNCKEFEGEGSSSKKRNKFLDKMGTPEVKMDVVSEPQAEIASVPTIQIVSVSSVEGSSKVKSQVDPVPLTVAELFVSESEVEGVTEKRVGKEKRFIINADNEEELACLAGPRMESILEQGRPVDEGIPEKAEENGDGRQDHKRELYITPVVEGECGQGVKDVAGNAPEFCIGTASSEAEMKNAAAIGDGILRAKVDDRKLDKRHHILSKEVLQAYRYFDRNRLGYLKADDVRRLLHSVGRFLSHRNIKELVACAVSESCKARDERIVYRNFMEKGAGVK